MHDTAEKNAKWFFEKYVTVKNPKILEIGSWAPDPGQFLIRDIAPDTGEYIGMDLQAGNNVDIVSTDTFKFPFEDNTFDYVISSSCFEHDEFFWVTYLEILRVLKPGGLFYLNAPSNGPYHGYPGDCWRFYMDAGSALVKWGNKNGYTSSELLEAFITEKIADVWEDYVCVFKK